VLRPRTLRVRLGLIFGLTTTVVAASFGALLLHQARRQLSIAIDEGLITGPRLHVSIAIVSPNSLPISSEIS